MCFRAFTGHLLYNNARGTYKCVVCGNELFSSDHKYNPGTGWPSFYDVHANTSVIRTPDNSFGKYYYYYSKIKAQIC